MRTLAQLTVIVTAAACAVTATGLSSADPAANVSPAQIDSLVVPIDQIVPRMDYTTVSKVPAPSPATPQGAPSPADPCYLDALRPGAAELFGTGVQAFRDVNYSGVSNILVNQAIGVYADSAAAAAVVGRLTEGLSACRASGRDGLNIGRMSPAGASWSGSICGDEARAVRNVVIRVQACHMDNPAGLASSVADAISAKVDSAN